MTADGPVGYPDLVKIRSRWSLVACGVAVLLVAWSIGLGLAHSDLRRPIYGVAGAALIVALSWVPCVVFGPQEMVVTNTFKSQVVAYRDIVSMEFNPMMWVHAYSLELSCRDDRWVSIDSVRRRPLHRLLGRASHAERMRAEIERRVALAQVSDAPG